MGPIEWNGWFAASAANAIIAVIAGVFASQIAAASLTDQGMFLYRQAADFHLSHSIAILGAAVLLGLANEAHRRLAERAAIFLQSGIILYSGSLYWHAAVAPAGDADFWLLTPLGGVLLIIGWLYLSNACYSIVWKQKGMR